MDDVDGVLNPRLYASLARPFLSAAPAWMDLEDLMQDARVASLQGRDKTWGIVDGLRRSKRKMRTRHDVQLPAERGWEVSLEELPGAWADWLPSSPERERELFLSKLIGQLTKTQRRFIQLLLTGMTNLEIAQTLAIDETSASHMHRHVVERLRAIMA